VGAIDSVDAERLLELGVRSDVIEITGDTRYDQVWQRMHRPRSAEVTELIESFRSDRPTLVAGSTWEADNAVLFPAIAELRWRVPELRVIVAPHEPGARHLTALQQWAGGAGMSLATLGTTQAGSADVVYVDRMGILGDLYALATVAFVGGGFHSAGLHSVLEPASFGVPVLFGPRHTDSRDAGLLLSRGAAASCATASALASAALEWFTVPSSRADAGEGARALVRSGLGAADRSLSIVRRLLGE
jgi:3-deoxy-D-manno-octulosonic-acid transferase